VEKGLEVGGKNLDGRFLTKIRLDVILTPLLLTKQPWYAKKNISTEETAQGTSARVPVKNEFSNR